MLLFSFLFILTSLILKQRLTPEPRVEFVHSKGTSLTPKLLATDHSKAVILI